MLAQPSSVLTALQGPARGCSDRSLPRDLITYSSSTHGQDVESLCLTWQPWLAGNYDTFQKSVRENEIIQAKQYEKEQADIKHIKEFIASCGWVPIPAPCLMGLQSSSAGSHPDVIPGTGNVRRWCNSLLPAQKRCVE